MKVSTAILCDFAQVRGGLLFVVSGCITRVAPPNLPAPARLQLALVFELDQVECERPHEIEVRVMDQEGSETGSVVGGFQATSENSELSEKLQVPMVLDLRDMLVDEGAHDINIYIDGNHQHTLTFWVIPAPPDAQGSTPTSPM